MSVGTFYFGACLRAHSGWFRCRTDPLWIKRCDELCPDDRPGPGVEDLFQARLLGGLLEPVIREGVVVGHRDSGSGLTRDHGQRRAVGAVLAHRAES